MRLLSKFDVEFNLLNGTGVSVLKTILNKNWGYPIHFSEFKMNLYHTGLFMNKKLLLNASERLKSFKEEKRLQKIIKENTKKLGKESPPIDYMVVYHRQHRYPSKRRLVETCELKNHSGYKFLKIWEYYEPNEVSDLQWKHSKRGIIIPIKDAKRWIKKMYHHYYPPKTDNPK